MIQPDDPRVQDIINTADSKAEAIDRLLELGLTKKQIMGLGYVEATVRKEINKFKDENRSVPGGSTEGADLVLSPYSPVVLRGTEHISPAWMAQRLAAVVDGDARTRNMIEFLLVYPLYNEDLMTQVFKRNLMAVTAVKGDQTKELIEQMRLGAQQAADAAHDAAMETAALMTAGQKEAALAGSANPLQARMMDMMWPYVQNIFGRVAGGLLGGGAQPTQPTQPSVPTQGFTRRSVGSIEELDKEKKAKEDKAGSESFTFEEVREDGK